MPTTQEPQSSFRSASEHFTVLSAAAAASLYTVGEIAYHYKLAALGIAGIKEDSAWQDRVFQGALALINLVLKLIDPPRPAQYPLWLGTVAALGAALWLRHRAAPRPRVRRVLTGASGVLYLAMLLISGIVFGRLQAEFARYAEVPDQEFIFAADAASRLPAALIQDNQRHALRVLSTNAEFFIVMGSDHRTIYRIPTRDIALFTAHGKPPATEPAEPAEPGPPGSPPPAARSGP